MIMFLTQGLYVMPPDNVEVEPCFVMAALIGRAQALHIAVNREGTMKPYFPLSIAFRRFQKPTHVSPIARNRSRSPTMVVGQEALAKHSQQRPQR